MENYCDDHEYHYTGDECPLCERSVGWACQEADTSIVVGDETLPAENLELIVENDKRENIGLATGTETFHGSFTIQFEDEGEARKFREYFF